MHETGNERLYQELEKFVTIRRRSFFDHKYLYKHDALEYEDWSAEERLNYINSIWERPFN